MVIRVQCNCGKRLKVKDELAGKTGNCPNCGENLKIPKPKSTPVPKPKPFKKSKPPRAKAPLLKSNDQFVTAQDIYGTPESREQLRDQYRHLATLEEPEETELMDHVGETIRHDVDLFAEPPKEICPILSAWSDRIKGQKPVSWLKRTLVLGILITLLTIVGIGIGMLAQLGGKANELWSILLPLLCGLLFFGMGFFLELPATS